MPSFIYSNLQREMDVYDYDKGVKSHCLVCHGPLCSKGIVSLQLANHPDRLAYPVFV